MDYSHDPFVIRLDEALKLQIDLAAESAIAAERDGERIAVEIKSFIAESDISEFHVALGQYLNYIQALEDQEPDRILYLAVPNDTYGDFFQAPFIQKSLQRHQINILTDNLQMEEIVQWIKSKNIDK